MEVAAPPGNLQQLTQRLQGHLQLLPQLVPFEVQSVLRQGKLMVLSQHPGGWAPVPAQVFETLQVAIQTLAPAIVAALYDQPVPPARVPVQLYLRVQGQKHPYAMHRFTFVPGEPQPAPEPELADGAEAPKQVEPNVESEASDRPSADVFPQPHPTAAEPIAPEASEIAPIEESTSLETLEAEAELEETPRSQFLPWIVAGMIVSVVSFIGGLSLMTRPCLLGGCEPFQAAQELTQKSSQTLKTAKSWDDLRAAQQQIGEANRLFDRVPAWSARHGEADATLQDNLKQAATLKQLLEIEAQAETAIQKSQKVPQSVKDWQTVEMLWRQAIDQLKAIPPTSPLAAFAQQRRATYEQNLATIQQSIAAEKQGQKSLQAAQSTAKIATNRQGVAQTLAGWQLAQATWQTAVNSLKQVQASSTSYAEAKELLADYEPKLATVRDRLIQEQTGGKAYTQAVNMARSAQASERQTQWSRAVFLWREALNYAKQVPAGTLRFTEAQAVMAEYTTALSRAEAQLQSIVALQKTRTDLDRVCAGSPKICTYTLTSTLIRLRYTPSYEQALKSAFAAGRSNAQTLGGAVNHVETLQTALQSISTNAQLPLEVYSADGSELMGSFNPGG